MIIRARACALAVVVASLPCGMARTAAAVGEEKPSCCFSNPSYSGTCQVKPVDDETCSTILSYLNTPLSTGKSYCSNTDIRGGWKQETCEKPKAQSAPRRAPRP